MTKEVERLAPEWITPVTEKENENPNQFKVRGLDELEALDFTGEMSLDDEGVFKITGRGRRSALRLGVMDAKGRSFPDGYVPELLGKSGVGAYTLQIVCNKIVNKSRLLGEEIKN